MTYFGFFSKSGPWKKADKTSVRRAGIELACFVLKASTDHSAMGPLLV